MAKKEFTPSAAFQERYQGLESIGDGGTGEVFAAIDTHLNRQVAIKWIKTKGVDDQVLADPWAEAKKLAAVSHPNIVSVYDRGQDQMRPYIVMELIDGETVEDSVQRGLFNLQEFEEFAVQTLEGLAAAHQAGIIHRDIKPANIMLAPCPGKEFQIKILDFGLARFLTTPKAQTLNLDGTIAGSIYWISPEQVLQKPVDSRCDLYSVGSVCYYTLTGKQPFDCGNVFESLQAKLDHRIDHIQKLRPDLDRLLGQWIMGMMNPDPDDRYQTAEEALAVLKYVLHPPTVVAVPKQPEPEQQPEQHEGGGGVEAGQNPEFQQTHQQFATQPQVARAKPKAKLNAWVIALIAMGVLLIGILLVALL
jgi:serine/threonine-protein kinase